MVVFKFLLCASNGFAITDILWFLKVQLGTFDWKTAQEKAHGEKISTTAHIFSSLHFNIAKLVRNPIPNLLQVCLKFFKQGLLDL